MQSLTDRIRLANTLLAPYAVPHEGALGRETPEAPDETRAPFQRDRDRIIHTKSFRRLKGKTQVFVAGIGDHYRTRLTHTMEVAQISRDMARTLCLNEDLAECIALSHDLGHPPFGHAGEEALDAWMTTHGSSFEHNNQSLRIVRILEPHLNVNIEVLEGLMKHRTPHDHPSNCLKRASSLEAQVVNIADEIAYTGHDVDDGLRAGLFSLEQLRTVPFIREIEARPSGRHSSLRGALIAGMVTDIYAQTEENLRTSGILTLKDVYAYDGEIVAFSAAAKDFIDSLRAFLWNNMYLHPTVLEKMRQGQTIVTDLCDHLFACPSQKVEELVTTHGSERFEAVKDYVAGMTDSFAEQEYIGVGG